MTWIPIVQSASIQYTKVLATLGSIPCLGTTKYYEKKISLGEFYPLSILKVCINFARLTSLLLGLRLFIQIHFDGLLSPTWKTLLESEPP